MPEEIATHLREPEPRLPWTRIKDHAEALVGQGLSREEAVQHAGHTEWAGVNSECLRSQSHHRS
jgi:hypothetical protein